jgi:ribosomal protein S18 acetylase RimI-like enzyme
MAFNFVVSTSTRAIALWKSFGLEVVGRLPGAFEHLHEEFVDALVMFRELSSATPPTS